MATYKGVEISLKPTEGMAAEARKFKKWREEGKQGGTDVAVARATQLANRQELSADTVRRMHSFFSRHEVDKQAEGFSAGEDGYPSKGRVAWAAWGGDAGQTWARAKDAALDRIDEGERGIEMSEIEPIENSDELVDNAPMERHIQNITETEDTVTITFGKSDAPVVETAGYDDEEMDRLDRGELVFRARAADMVEEDDRRVRMSISSEEPVERSFGLEVLRHSDGAVDLSRL
ncbi:MAG: phage major capsid protein, partial [Candidatus Puniceispirillaceae bacterium]